MREWKVKLPLGGQVLLSGLDGPKRIRNCRKDEELVGGCWVKRYTFCVRDEVIKDPAGDEARGFGNCSKQIARVCTDFVGSCSEEWSLF